MAQMRIKDGEARVGWIRDCVACGEILQAEYLAERLPARVWSNDWDALVALVAKLDANPSEDAAELRRLLKEAVARKMEAAADARQFRRGDRNIIPD